MCNICALTDREQDGNGRSGTDQHVSEENWEEDLLPSPAEPSSKEGSVEKEVGEHFQ